MPCSVVLSLETNVRKYVWVALCLTRHQLDCEKCVCRIYNGSRYPSVGPGDQQTHILYGHNRSNDCLKYIIWKTQTRHALSIYVYVRMLIMKYDERKTTRKKTHSRNYTLKIAADIDVSPMRSANVCCVLVNWSTRECTYVWTLALASNSTT